MIETISTFFGDRLLLFGALLALLVLGMAGVVFKAVASVNKNAIRANTFGQPLNLDVPPGATVVEIEGPDGSIAAFEQPGHGALWLLTTHGVGGDLSGTKPFLAAAKKAGIPALAFTYRNHAGGPSTDGISTFGQRELSDVIAVIKYAQSQGAQSVVLAGNSHGGAVVLQAAYQGGLRGVVKGVLLLDPATSIARIVTQKIDDSMPVLGRVVAWASLAWISWRANVNFKETDYIARISELQVPVLFMQGTADKTVPPEFANVFKDASPELVHVEFFEGAAHVKAPQLQPERFDALVVGFIDQLRS